MQATKQDSPKRDADGKLLPGNTANPEGKGGFQDHPELRSNGRWDKEGSISYQYQRLMRMSTEELSNFKPETVAQDIAMARIRAARDARLGLGDAKEITDRTEGKAPQSVDVTSGGEPIKTSLVQFVSDDGNDPEQT